MKKQELLYEEARLGEGVYTFSNVANILKIKKSRARYLINQYLNNKFKIQQKFNYCIEENGSYTVNFLSLIEIFVFDKLSQKNFSSKKIATYHDYLSSVYKTTYPFAVADFIINGENLYRKVDKKWITSDNQRQIGLTDIIEYLGEKIEYDTNNNAAKYYPIGKDKSIVVDPSYRFGQPILEDTKLVVENLYDLYLAEDKNKDYVANLYKISLGTMDDVISYMNIEVA